MANAYKSEGGRWSGWVPVILAACVVASGCAAPGFLADRKRDALDIVTASVGYGVGAKVHAGPLNVGLLGNLDSHGLRGGVVGDISGPEGAIYSVVDVNVLGFGVESFWEGLARRKEYSAVSLFGIGFAGSKLAYYTQLEVVIALGGSLRLGLNPGELLDFALGWVGLDIFGDDLEKMKQRPYSAHAIGLLSDAEKRASVPKLVTALRSTEPATRRAAAHALGVARDTTVWDTLVQARMDQVSYVRIAILNALTTIDAKKAWPFAVEAVSDSKAEVREHAIRMLGRSPLPAVIDPLLGAAQDSVPRVRAAAVTVLGKIADNRAHEGVVAALVDPEPNVRERAIWALDPGASADAVLPVLGMVSDADAGVRHQATIAVCKMRDARAVPVLIETLRHDRDYLRRSSAEALGEIGDSRAIEPLIDALSVDAREVAYARALKAITGQRLGRDPEAWREWFDRSGGK